MLSHETVGLDREGHTKQGTLFEDLDEQDRVLLNRLGRFEVQGILAYLQTLDPQAGDDSSSVRLLCPGHRLVHETQVEVFDVLHVAVHGPQTSLHGLLPVCILETQVAGQSYLMLEVELIALPSCNPVQPVSHLPDEGNSL